MKHVNEKKCLVLLSTYNGEAYLSEMIGSVEHQEGISIAMLIRDDGSSDSTIKIIEPEKGKYGNIDFYYGENLKPALSFMDLIMRAPVDYDYYAFCDQDDYWMPNKLEKAVIELEGCATDKPALYSGAVEIVDKDLKYIGYYSKDNSFKYGLYDIVMYATMGCTFVFNKHLILHLKKHRPETIRMHDIWTTFICYALDGEMIYDDRPYVKYRQHENNVVGAVKKSYFDTFRKLVSHSQVLVSDMCKELLLAYGNQMNEQKINDFKIVSMYKSNLRYRLKILSLKYKKGYSDRNRFWEMKIRALVGKL